MAEPKTAFVVDEPLNVEAERHITDAEEAASRRPEVSAASAGVPTKVDLEPARTPEEADAIISELVYGPRVSWRDPSISMDISRFVSARDDTGMPISLKLVGRGLTRLSESIGRLTSLQTLDLGHNHLTSLPESIGALVNLQKLDLSYNQLTSLPESIGALANLQKLYLYYNQLTSLPESIGALASLHTLWLTVNQLSSLPESIGHLNSLQRLYLCYNQLTSLPESIVSLSSLREIYLSGNCLRKNELRVSLESIASLDNLSFGEQHTSRLSSCTP